MVDAELVGCQVCCLLYVLLSAVTDVGDTARWKNGGGFEWNTTVSYTALHCIVHAGANILGPCVCLCVCVCVCGKGGVVMRRVPAPSLANPPPPRRSSGQGKLWMGPVPSPWLPPNPNPCPLAPTDVM